MEKGLSSHEVNQLLAVHGKNEITAKRSFSPFILFLSQFPSFLNGILFLAAIFSFFISDVLDAVFILAILLLNGTVGFIQEYNAEKSLEKLKNYVLPLSRVLRNGKEEEIPTSDIVPGDIVILSEGDRIPADGVLVHHEDLEVDESILTGESLPVAKEQNAEVFGGTLVLKGKGHLKIQKTGMKTHFGQIAETLSTLSPDKTPLNHRLNVLGKIISFIAILAALSIIPIGLSQNRELFPLILLSISITVAAVPQSLPTVITIALAIGTTRMAKKNAIVRKMHAVETLGSIQVLLVDKTGTLTENSMRVKKYWIQDKKKFESLLRACIFGNTASLAQKGSQDKYDIIGDRTDGALLLWAKSHAKNLNTLKDGGEITDEFVFDPEQKTITTVWEEHGKKYVFVRGAPEAIIEESELSEKEKTKITKFYEDYASNGLRVIAFGEKLEKHKGSVKRDHLEKNLDFLGFVGIYDPPRDEAREAVLKARNAGITTIMVTGDNEKTALSIAKDVGILEKDEDVITGEELEKLNDDEVAKIIDHVRVFARSRPEDKLRLVTILKKKGYVVGVTGDGVNDSLALKRADVGVSMGQTGTDVAKEASDIVLADDNFSTLVSAVEEGRIIYHNILKAITYLLSGNLSELSLIVFATLLGLPSPLIPTQILWINLITDGLPALALASDNKDPDLIKDGPRNPKTPILSKKRSIFIALVGLSLSFFLLSVFYLIINLGKSEMLARTVVFNLLIFSHMGLAFVVRGKSLFKFNPFLVWGVFGIIILQIIITFTPFFQDIFHLGFK
ncbi:MAG: cation-translocating P-type ATPase [Candidatus Levybacteria bacterium]|nr:cation-translocating P-type ATPase [Candidatus Levybacteria bacterium]